MPRYTLTQFKQTANWVQFLGMDSSDPRWLLLLNEALQRLVAMPQPWCGKVQSYRFCANSSCITCPRQFETIEVMDICNQPYQIRNQWFEYLENGPGYARTKMCGITDAFDRGRGFVMFDDIRVASKIRLYPQFNSDVGKVVNIRGFDSVGQEVLTDNGTTIGENITIASPYVDSVTTWMPQVFREVILPRRAGYLRCYSYDASLPPPPASPTSSDTPLTALASWEPTETIPNYRRYFIPTLSVATTKGCGCSNGLSTPSSCNKYTVTIMAKLAFIPIESELDVLPLTSAPAIKLAMLSVLKQERGDDAGAKAAMYGILNPATRRYEDGAIPILEDELAAQQGDGTVVPLRLESRLTDRAYVVNLI